MNYLAREALPKSMPAIVCHGPEDYRLEEWRVPEPAAGEVVIRVQSVGICASDLKCYQGAPLFWGDESREGYCQPPVIPGHEFVGEVVALGEGAGEKYGLQLGDIAVSEQIVPCWGCRFCKRAANTGCARTSTMSTAFAKPPSARWPSTCSSRSARSITKCPTPCPPITPPSSSRWAAPSTPSSAAKSSWTMWWSSPAAVRSAWAWWRRRASRIRSLLIAIDLNDDRLEIAELCGADMSLNPRKTDVIDEVLKLTEGYGCDVYIEATGYPAAVTQGLQMIRKLGTFVEFSVMREPVTADWTIIGDTKELNIHGSHLSPYTYPIAIDMLCKGLLPMERIMTHDLPLSEFHAGMDLVAAGTESVKVTLTP